MGTIPLSRERAALHWRGGSVGMRAGLRRLPAPVPEQLPRLEVAEVGLCGTEPSGLLHCQKASPSRGTVRAGHSALKTASGLWSA